MIAPVAGALHFYLYVFGFDGVDFGEAGLAGGCGLGWLFPLFVPDGLPVVLGALNGLCLAIMVRFSFGCKTMGYIPFCQINT